MDRDDRLAALIEQLTAEQKAGRRPDVAAAAAANPDLAAELNDLWAVAQFAALAPTLTAVYESPFPADPATPPREFGDFEIVGELGRGGMGVVYKARQKSLDRVALKMIREARTWRAPTTRPGSAPRPRRRPASSTRTS